MREAGWRRLWAIARRDLSPRLQGLRLLFLCLFLGVATLAAIGSLSSAITAELERQGQEILGGDIEFAISQRQANATERSSLSEAGGVSETIRMRAMAQRPAEDGGGAVLAELKGVDPAYPLYGRLVLSGAAESRFGASGVAIDKALATRLDLDIGHRLRFGEADFTVVALIEKEPDRVGEGFTLGPVAMVSLDGLARTQLVRPGSLFESKYRIRLPAGADAKAQAAALAERFPSAGWEVKDRDRAAPGASRFFLRMGQFLSLIGLIALVVAGIGVSNGVASYLARKRDGIATLKVLGATSKDVVRIHMLQIGAVAALAICCGLAVGALAPAGLIALFGDRLPVQPEVGLHALPLVTSAAYGLLIALIFALPPLGRARRLPAAALFRAAVEHRRTIDRRSLAVVSAAAAATLLLAIVPADQPWFALSVLGATAGLLLLLLLFGWTITRLAARAPRPRRPLLRLALANLHRPSAQTIPLVIALGLGLTLFTALVAIQTSIDSEIDGSIPGRAPNQFVLDIPLADEARFRALVRDHAPGAALNMVPSMRGTITAFSGQRVADLETVPEGAWFLKGDRGLTYSDSLPQGSDLVAGAWWPKDYDGPPLVSLDQEAAKILGIGVGDTLTVSLLGREIEARIASLRHINWETMGFNYIMVFSPNSLRGAPHVLTAAITGEKSHELALSRTLLGSFPSISIIDVGELIAQVSTLLDQMAVAIALTGSVTILAGIAVLVGAIAASSASRSYDSVILKTVGATRAQILGVLALEYAVLALMLAGLALALGTMGGWYVVVHVFEFGWAPDWARVLATLATGALATVTIGIAGALPVISVRPATALRRLQTS